MADKFDELDELDDIERQGSSNTDLLLSNVYNIKIGGFGSENSIRTYLCTVKVSDLEEDIAFYETLTKDKSWPVSQIIQREVDRIRVSNISKDYILGQGREIKYFPPLIIAILPRDEEGKINLTLNYATDNGERIKELIYERSVYRSNEKIKKYFLSGSNHSLIDGLYVLEVSKIFDFNLLTWDKAKYYAVVIDGQHRLASLFKSKKDNALIGNYLQDVVFMDFSYLIHHNSEKYTPIEVVRRVFIDINTNAKKVGPVRQILMDDKDLASLFVQSMVDAVKRDGSDKSTNSFIPSPLVDWYGESLKHTLPHLTGILSLYQILDDYLIKQNLTSIDDLRSKSKVKAWTAQMNNIFLVDDKIRTIEKYNNVEPLAASLERYYRNVEDNAEYIQELDENSRETEIFSFDYNVLDIAQETFEEKFLCALIKVFDQFLPYKEAIAIITQQNGFEAGTLTNKALISSRNKIANDNQLKEKVSELRRLLEGDLYSRYYHIFTVLGQKVVFNILFQRIFSSYNSLTTEVEILAITDGFLNEMNRMLKITSLNDMKLFDKKENIIVNINEDDDLIEFGNLSTMFWEGIIYENNKIIYNTQGISSFTSLIHHILARIDEIITGREARPFVVTYLPVRLKRILKKNYGIEDGEANSYVQRIIDSKSNFLESYLKEAIEKYNQQT